MTTVVINQPQPKGERTTKNKCLAKYLANMNSNTCDQLLNRHQEMPKRTS